MIVLAFPTADSGSSSHRGPRQGQNPWRGANCPLPPAHQPAWTASLGKSRKRNLIKSRTPRGGKDSRGTDYSGAIREIRNFFDEMVRFLRYVGAAPAAIGILRVWSDPPFGFAPHFLPIK